jgi:hypothetical protein
VLSFDFSAKVLLFRVSDETRSWFDPVARQSLRYTKRERSPLADRDERVEIVPEEGRWMQGDDTFPLAAEAPLAFEAGQFVFWMNDGDTSQVYVVRRRGRAGLTYIGPNARRVAGITLREQV